MGHFKQDSEDDIVLSGLNVPLDMFKFPWFFFFFFLLMIKIIVTIIKIKKQGKHEIAKNGHRDF